MQRSIYAAVAAFSLVCLTTGCRWHSHFSQPEFKRPATTDTTSAGAAASGSNAFGFDLLKDATARQPTGNVFLSPTSLYLGLAMTSNGADGKTKAAMEHALRLDQIPKSISANAANAALLAALTDGEDGRIKLSIANALWADKRVHLDAAFVQTCGESYDAVVNTLDFQDSSNAAQVINDWANEKTNGMISRIVDASSFTPSPAVITDIVGASLSKNPTVAALTDAVYFKGIWSHTFAVNQTSSATFHRSPSLGGDKTVQMMHDAEFPAAAIQNEGFEAVRMPYSEGRYAFYAFLPDASSDADSLAGAMTLERWNAAVGKLKQDTQGNVDLRLPRFQIDFSADMKAALVKEGMGSAFNETADFRHIGDGVYLGSVLHKSVLKVDEEGSEAAAVTVGIAEAGSAPPLSRTITFDRPFLCAIVDDTTGAILFEGIVRDPQ